MKARSITLASAALAVGIATLAAGCGSSASPTPSANNKVHKGGNLTVAMPAATNLDWFIPVTDAAADQVYNGWLQDQIYKPLIHLNDAYQIVWKSSAAKKITYNKAGTVYHVYLNPKWKWSNGQTLSAKDLMFTWNVIKAASASNAAAPWPYVGAGTGDVPNGIKSVVQNSNTEVTFTLDKPANQQWFIYNGLIQMTPMPAKALDKYGSNWSKEIKYLGSIATNPTTAEKASDGPFVLKSATPNQSWVMTPNPDYGGHKSVLSKLTFAYEASTTSEFAALQSGSIDLGYLDPSQLGASGSLKSKGDKIFSGYSLGVFWSELNMWPKTSDASIFKNLYVRQALNESTDQNSIVKDIYKGYGVPQYGPIPSTPKSKFYSASAEPTVPYSTSKAKSLLESHGWKEVNGVMTKGSQKMNFTLLYVSGSQSLLEQVQLMQSDWAKIGVKTTLKGVNFNTFLTMTSNKTASNWQIAVGSGWDYNGPGWYPTGGQLFSSTAPSGTGYSNKTEDSLIAATHVPYATAADTMSAFDKYEAFTAKHLPFLWLPNPGSIDVESGNMTGGAKYANPTTGNPAFNYMTVK